MSNFWDTVFQPPTTGETLPPPLNDPFGHLLGTSAGLDTTVNDAGAEAVWSARLGVANRHNSHCTKCDTANCSPRRHALSEPKSSMQRVITSRAPAHGDTCLRRPHGAVIHHRCRISAIAARAPRIAATWDSIFRTRRLGCADRLPSE